MASAFVALTPSSRDFAAIQRSRKLRAGMLVESES